MNTQILSLVSMFNLNVEVLIIVIDYFFLTFVPYIIF